MDRASDAIRVDARDVRARVIGEGGNLGLTRRARVEYAREGGLVNADFIDNSAGVDCSDHEVNLKILLGLAERRGELDRPARDALLLEVTDDVVAHVLYDSFLQAQILSEEVVVSKGRMYAYEDLMTALEGRGLLDRGAEKLPGTEEIAERRRANRGLERPELALLLAYAKQALALDLLDSDFCEDPWLERDLREYFPGRVVERFGHLLGEHPLRRELIAMINANTVVNSLGPTFVSQLSAERGAEPAEIVRAYRIARDVTGAEARWDAVERLPRGTDRDVVTELMVGVDRLVEATTRWYLAHGAGDALEDRIAAAEAPFARLMAVLPDIGSDEWRAQRRATADGLIEQGVPAEVAWAHALTPELMQAPTSSPSPSTRAGRSRRSRARSTRWPRGSRSSGCSARSTSCRSRRARSAGRSRRCARTAWTRSPSWPAARSGRRAGAGRGRGGPRVPRAAHRAEPAPGRGHRVAHRGGHRRPAGAHARRPRRPGARRLMARLILGPLLRYTGEDDATIWVETDAPARSRCSAAASARSTSRATTTRSSTSPGSSRRRRSRTRCGSTASTCGPSRTRRIRRA